MNCVQFSLWPAVRLLSVSCRAKWIGFEYERGAMSHDEKPKIGVSYAHAAERDDSYGDWAKRNRKGWRELEV